MNIQEGRGTPQPFRTIWTSPRLTIRSLVDTDATRYVYFLAIAAGIATYLSASAGKGLGAFLSLQSIILLALIFGPVIGLIRLFVGGALLRWTGSWIGGAGTAPQIRAALAWSMAPELVSLALLILAVVMFGKSFFLNPVWYETSVSGSLLSFLSILKIARILLWAWGMYILSVCLSEVQKFSAWKGIANILLASGVVIVPMLALLALLFYASGMSSLS